MLTYPQKQTAVLRQNQLLLQTTQQTVPAALYSYTVKPETSLVRISENQLRALILFTRNSGYLQLKTLVDIAVVDKHRATARFAISYKLLSMVTNQRIVIQLFASETSTIPSLITPYSNGQRLFSGAAWQEREAWDLYGVHFKGHGDLRRILTDYGSNGHPLRKDYPLSGFSELAYNGAKGRVASAPALLAQEFRVFHLRRKTGFLARRVLLLYPPRGRQQTLQLSNRSLPRSAV